jgi:peptidoglycan/xylan/chitin deacetylase (PgdA/CDA1 family)
VIGVLAKESETRTVQEFFELFKTPWEFWSPDHTYDLVILTRDQAPEDLKARLLVICSSRTTSLDDGLGVVMQPYGRSDSLEWQRAKLPVYGDIAVFHSARPPLLRVKKTGDVAGAEVGSAEPRIVRVGFDLFWEVAFLLSHGQPPENAQTPTLDMHIELIRAIMVGASVPFVEIPPLRPGYDFMACLTHDVDFVGIRDHKFDHTMWGFLYRSVVGSMVRALRGNLAWSKCLESWKAALALPLVHLGIYDDFWLEFERYKEIEKDFGSTFFFIPFKNVAGSLGSAPAPKRRAAKYDIILIKQQVLELLKEGCEVGLHGIDAWQNCENAQIERDRLRQVTEQAPTGIRMHWLYWGEDSAKSLEDAGFSYDSTFGYNDAVGFRAGTTQPFCPLSAESLIELPLSIQDSAMFYSDRMKLSEDEALNICKDVIRSALSFGGSLTVNWHTRSLSPERLWGDFYVELLKEIQKHRVWFGPAKDIVSWFRKRRALSFDSVQIVENRVRVRLGGHFEPSEGSFTVRVHYSIAVSDELGAVTRMPAYVDRQWNGEEEMELSY